MPIPKIPKDDEDLPYFLTFTTIDWIDIFTTRKYFEILIDSLKFCQKKGLKIHGYVLMRNHLHLLVSSIKKSLPSLIQSFKRHTTREIKRVLIKDKRKYVLQLIEKSLSKKKGNLFQIWQHSNYPEFIETEKFFFQKLEYIHNNPVKAGYVKKPEDYLFSSARNYELHDDSIIKIDRIDP
ncbi:transposase [Patescibacteria group bacterium]